MAARRGSQERNKVKGLDCPTHIAAGIEIIGEISGLTNLKTVSDANENPGALAGATGAKDVVESVKSWPIHTPKPRSSASHEVHHG
ncbi:hypothetical protein GCM10011319_41810 [Mameliella alba]|nr:hypothetical protein GCM10011319_41810 [Mameliella alba]